MSMSLSLCVCQWENNLSGWTWDPRPETWVSPYGPRRKLVRARHENKQTRSHQPHCSGRHHLLRLFICPFIRTRWREGVGVNIARFLFSCFTLLLFVITSRPHYFSLTHPTPMHSLLLISFDNIVLIQNSASRLQISYARAGTWVQAHMCVTTHCDKDRKLLLAG